MSHLENLVAIAYHLGMIDEDMRGVGLSQLDTDDFLTVCQAILEDFYAQGEYAYVKEYLEYMEPSYYEDLCEKLF